MRNARYGWLVGLVIVALLALVGIYAYNIGVAHGLAESGRLVAAPGTAAPPLVMWYPRPWGWGWGFGFFPVFPLFFLLFWFVLLRGLFWRGRRHGYGYRGGCGYRGDIPQQPPAATKL